MSTLLQEKAYVIDLLGKDEVQTIPCAILSSDGEELKLWVGSFADSETFEETAARGEAYIIKFAVGSSEVAYWCKKYPIIEMQWRRDVKWREWVNHSLLTQRKKWSE